MAFPPRDRPIVCCRRIAPEDYQFPMRRGTFWIGNKVRKEREFCGLPNQNLAEALAADLR